MKVAFIGKGGSGKSTVSWLARTLAANGRQVLAIDADHNMDFASLLGVAIDAQTPTLHRRHDAFLKAVAQAPGKSWGDIVLDERTLPNFCLAPMDAYTSSIALPTDVAGIDLAVVGLGADDVLFSDKCAHGHSAPLKFYLPLLAEGADADVVIDGVAGADMMNFGLFLGCDAVVVVVEPHPNSMRVLAQVAGIADRTGLPLYVVVNKVQGPTPHLEQIEGEWRERIIGRIPADTGLLSYDFGSLRPETKHEATSMLEAVRARSGQGDGLARLRNFEAERAKAFS